ncbi:bifunctional 2-polyprenyl-6-hydroxyphenol methylase/3-demethylubiquinol 3-O-methyltransferase UbiG [Streptomyces sp. A1136]|uniref:class I SAM-dependent methyltransferase n=1 Tax=Streptomyces sp. A1136 TaxID=2563102 RepID=UPI00109E623A|nr:class I SAM-dependent methyltransferase [Streptomyces sp. A1136]THA50874.1 class I SAM-dependent methyltransferase [Streptomyces sp. A1136]
MTPRPRALAALDRFNAAHPWDHNAHYHRWILRQVPKRCARALDIGCGSGELAGLLATRAQTVIGIDADPTIVALARATAPAEGRMSFVTGDALTAVPRGPYDIVTCVAAVHHMPFGRALNLFRHHLAPGGTLVVVGVARADTVGDHLMGALSIPLNAAVGWLRNRGRPAPRPAAMTARTRPPVMTFAEIGDQVGAALPGARLRRRLFWRYTLVWHAP